jgi:P22 coat protein - gene protein 5
MTETVLTADVIAKEALAILDNELGWVDRVHRAYEDEFEQQVNGYKKGNTISIRRPDDGQVRVGKTMQVEDVIEGKVTLTVNQQIGADFDFDSQQLKLDISQLSERVIKPRMINIVNYMANDLLQVAYQGFYNWVGTPGQTVNSFADFYKAPERLNEMAVPMEDRLALLSPADHAGLIGSQTGLFHEGLVKDAYRRGKLGELGGCETYMSQVVPTHTNGTRDATTPLTDGVSQDVTYSAVKDTWAQDLVTDGWDSSATINKGDVFTLDGVYMVNPKTKTSTGILQQFVVNTAVTADETTTNDTTVNISPPIILSGPHQTVTLSGVSTTDGLTITPVGTASSAYKQNMVFHKNALALAVVPLAMPEGATGGSRASHKGISVRVQPTYDGRNDVSAWRLDLLYGRALIDPRLGTRLSGTG